MKCKSVVFKSITSGAHRAKVGTDVVYDSPLLVPCCDGFSALVKRGKDLVKKK